MAVQVTGYLFAGRLGIPVGQSDPDAAPEPGSCDDALVAPSPQTPFVTAPAMAAFLRVYEPLDVLPDLSASERAQWRALASSGAELPVIEERVAALRAACALPPRVVGDVDICAGWTAAVPLRLLSPPAPDAVVRACPADLSWRALIAVEELRLRAVPELLDAVLPRHLVEQATRELAERVAAGARPPHVRHSNWSIPLTWFAAFQPEQRLVESAELPAGREQADSPAESQPLRSDVKSLRYLAPMADTRRGVARALAVARRNGGRLLPERELEELGRWLEEFHARSVVELDYGPLVGLLPRAEGETIDDSVDLVAAAVAGLRSATSADGPQSEIEQLERVRDRWAAVRVFERAS